MRKIKSLAELDSSENGNGHAKIGTDEEGRPYVDVRYYFCEPYQTYKRDERKLSNGQVEKVLVPGKTVIFAKRNDANVETPYGTFQGGVVLYGSIAKVETATLIDKVRELPNLLPAKDYDGADEAERTAAAKSVLAKLNGSKAK